MGEAMPEEQPASIADEQAPKQEDTAAKNNDAKPSDAVQSDDADQSTKAEEPKAEDKAEDSAKEAAKPSAEVEAVIDAIAKCHENDRALLQSVVEELKLSS